MGQDIKIAEFMIEKKSLPDFIDNDNYGSIYLFTTENIKSMLQNKDLLKKKVLTVSASGDQVFNLLLCGVEDVDTYDINIFTKYYFYLKEAAIRVLHYQEFFDFFFPKVFFHNNKVFSEDLFAKIVDAIRDRDAKVFWQYLFLKYGGKRIYYSDLFIRNCYPKEVYMNCNLYLLNEKNYCVLQEKLNEYEYHFVQLNILKDLGNMDAFSKKYDFIYLSNILDELRIDNNLEYVRKIKELLSILKTYLQDNGMIGVCYLFCYLDEYWDDNTNSKIRSHLLREQYFGNDYYYEEFGSLLDLKGKILKNRDALMLTKKRNCEKKANTRFDKV